MILLKQSRHGLPESRLSFTSVLTLVKTSKVVWNRERFPYTMPSYDIDGVAVEFPYEAWPKPRPESGGLARPFNVTQHQTEGCSFWQFDAKVFDICLKPLHPLYSAERQAYECQLEYMRAVIRSLENGEKPGAAELFWRDFGLCGTQRHIFLA